MQLDCSHRPNPTQRAIKGGYLGNWDTLPIQRSSTVGDRLKGMLDIRNMDA